MKHSRLNIKALLITIENIFSNAETNGTDRGSETRELASIPVVCTHLSASSNLTQYSKNTLFVRNYYGKTPIIDYFEDAKTFVDTVVAKTFFVFANLEENYGSGDILSVIIGYFKSFVPTKKNEKQNVKYLF